MQTLLLASAATFLVMSASPLSAAQAEKTRARALILTGVNNHDWKATTPHLKSVLEKGGFQVDVSDNPDAPILSEAENLSKYGVIVLNLNRNPRWEAAREANFLDYVRKGGGLVVVHAADNAFPGWDEYDKLVGGTWRSKGTSFPDRGTFHPPFGDFEVKVVDAEHPITKGIGPTFKTRDEMYTNLKLHDNIHVLAQGDYQGRPQPLLFVSTYGKGRMFQTALGHDLNAMRTPEFVETLVRGTRWAVGGKG